MINRIKERIIERWDFFVYWIAHKSLNRMCQRNAGFAYLFELRIREWRLEHPISPELEAATESFHESMKTWPKTTTH